MRGIKFAVLHNSSNSLSVSFHSQRKNSEARVCVLMEGINSGTSHSAFPSQVNLSCQALIDSIDSKVGKLKQARHFLGPKEDHVERQNFQGSNELLLIGS